MNFPWLAERKHQAVRERKKKSSKRIPSHAGYRSDIEFTGYGNPSDIAQITPSGPIHKNELIFNGPGNGSVVADATATNELLSNPVIGGRGFKCGGYSKSGYQTGAYVDSGYQAGGVAPNIQAPNTNVPVAPTIDRVGTDPQKIREKGIRGIEDIYERGSIAGRAAGQKQLSDIKSRQDVEQQVLKQEIAQRGTDPTQAAGQLARLRGQQEGALAETQAQIGIEEMQARERAAGQLTAEGAIQADIEMAGKQFEEFVRQFEVGSDQWDDAFKERRRQFEVGSEQWNRSFENQRDIEWQRLEEQKHQFDVGSEQWERARMDQMDQWSQSFQEQRRQFDVGTHQWTQSFQEERRRYDTEDDRWWASFDEQRRQFGVGAEQWTQAFDLQQRQFSEGTAQWNRVQEMREREFQRGLDMDKHSIDVWKDNIAHRDRAYVDNLNTTQARLEMERAAHEKNMKVIDLQIDAAEDSEKSRRYWEGSEMMYNYATTHLDGFNEETGEFTADAEAQMFKWFKTKYPDSNMDQYESPKAYEEGQGDKGFYRRFKLWAASEWKAASDNRLTNPYDKMLYEANSSEYLDDEAKGIIKKFLTSKEGLAGIVGIYVEPETKKVVIDVKEYLKKYFTVGNKPEAGSGDKPDPDSPTTTTTTTPGEWTIV
jgi:hypothetical protein